MGGGEPPLVLNLELLTSLYYLPLGFESRTVREIDLISSPAGREGGEWRERERGRGAEKELLRLRLTPPPLLPLLTLLPRY